MEQKRWSSIPTLAIFMSSFFCFLFISHKLFERSEEEKKRYMNSSPLADNRKLFSDAHQLTLYKNVYSFAQAKGDFRIFNVIC